MPLPEPLPSPEERPAASMSRLASMTRRCLVGGSEPSKGSGSWTFGSRQPQGDTAHAGDDARAMRGEGARLLRLAAPMMVAQGGLVTMGLVDTWCVGRLSPADMAGVALGNSLSILPLGVVLGVAMGIEPLVSQAHGAGELGRARAWRIQGLWTAGLVSVPAMLAVLLLALGLPYLGVAGGFEREGQAYLLGRVPGVLLAGLYASYRSYLASIGRPRPALYAVLVANVANLGLDMLFLFELGLGAGGVGLATSLASGIMVLVAAVSLREGIKGALPDWRPAWAGIRRVIALGWPVAAQMTAEIGVFSAVTTLIALDGAVALAGHQIAINFAALTFMAAVGIAFAGTARVGYHVGAGRTKVARQVGFLAIGLGALLMAGGAVVFLTIPERLAEAFAPSSPEVVAMAASLLRIAAAFAIFDGIQAVAAGALRGAGDTRSTFIANLAGHGLVGAPVALLLGHGLGLGAEGYWWGLTAGLTATAVGLLARFAALTARPLRRAEAA